MPIDPELARAYWAAVAPDSNPPESTGEALTDFLALVDGAKSDVAFSRVPFAVEDPYPVIAVAPEPDDALETWAAQVAELVPIASPALEPYVLYVDTVADAAGEHRVYPFSDGYPSQDIASLDDALRFMTVIIQHKQGDATKDEVEAVQNGLAEPADWRWSGAEVFGHFIDLPLHAAYQAWSLKTWPNIEVFVIDDLAPDAPGAERVGMLSAVMQVLETQRVALRRKPETMSDAHRALFAHLEDLTAAVSLDRAPDVVVKAVESSDAAIAQQAREWLARFEQAKNADDTPPEDTMQGALMRVVDAVLAKLEEAGAIEVEAASKKALVEELTLAALDANSPRHAIKRLCKTLLDSDHVEEVYVSDPEIEAAFVAAFQR
ncbi:MAG: hypothetical protein RKU31_27875 [Deltaproteobacteria bacterium]|jgi:hypothetical protein